MADEAEEIRSLPEGYSSAAPLLQRLQLWARDIKDCYGWYEISGEASEFLRADIEAAMDALGRDTSKAIEDQT